MRNITLTDDQFQQLLDILETAKADAIGWSQHIAESREDDKAVEEYCKGVDAVIALLEQATNNNQPPTLPSKE